MFMGPARAGIRIPERDTMMKELDFDDEDRDVPEDLDDEIDEDAVVELDDDAPDDVDDEDQNEPDDEVIEPDEDDAAPDDVDDDDQDEPDDEDELEASSSNTQGDDPAPPELPGQFGTVRWVPFRDLTTEYRYWTNPRSMTGLDDESIKTLSASILASTTSTESAVCAGIRQPLEVIRIAANGGIDQLVVDGQRRYLAAKAAGLTGDTLIPVIDLEPDPVVWSPSVATTYLVKALEGVGTRAGLSGFELSESAERLRATTDPETKKEYTIERVAAAIGRSASWVSKILTARANASPALMLKWKTGEIPEETFRDLAALPKQEQRGSLAKVEELASQDRRGARGAARAAAKEAKELAKAAKAEPAPPPAGKAKRERKPVVSGEQQTMPASPPRKAPPKAVIDDMLHMRVARPPTHDYVKGLMDGVRWAIGDLDAAEFGKPMRQYLTRVVDGGDAPAAPKPAGTTKRERKPGSPKKKAKKPAPKK